MSTSAKAARVLAIVVLLASAGYADWADSFDGGTFGLQWTFVSFPQVAGTFKPTITAGEGGNHYLTFTETTAVSKGGSAFSAGFGSSEKFKDVRVGATVNVAGDSRYCYYGLIARASYFIDPDGKLTGVAPGFVADGYILHVDYSNGPANVAINIEKVKMNQNVMDKTPAAVIPSALGARSYYAELDLVGANPVTVTGRLYESKGGALLAEVSFVDTDAKDPWEDADKAEKVFAEGLCGIFAQNEQNDGEPDGFKCTWDDVSAVADFPRAPSLVIDDFEGYADNAQVGAVWVDNIEGFDYVFLDGATASQGYKALRLEAQNQFEPYTTEATRTFAAPQDWTAAGTDLLSIMYHGYYVDPEKEATDKYGCNKEQPLYVKVVDAAGNEATATLPGYVIQSASWRTWGIALADLAGVDLTTVTALTIGVGDGTGNSGQADQDIDAIYVDNIRLGYLPAAR